MRDVKDNIKISGIQFLLIHYTIQFYIFIVTKLVKRRSCDDFVFNFEFYNSYWIRYVA